MANNRGITGIICKLDGPVKVIYSDGVYSFGTQGDDGMLRAINIAESELQKVMQQTGYHVTPTLSRLAESQSDGVENGE